MEGKGERAEEPDAKGGDGLGVALELLAEVLRLELGLRGLKKNKQRQIDLNWRRKARKRGMGGKGVGEGRALERGGKGWESLGQVALGGASMMEKNTWQKMPMWSSAW